MGMDRKVTEDPHDWSPSGDIPGEPIWPRFVDAYLQAALWSSVDVDGKTFDEKYHVSHFTQKAVNKAIRDSNNFIIKNRKALESVGSEGQHGHDFWMTRNGHGVGFWDRGYGTVGDRLTKAAHKYGEESVVSDGDKVEFM